MDYTNLMQFVPQQLGILVAALWVVGYFLKGTKKVSDSYIPFILAVLGIAGSVLMMGISVTSVLQGIISTAVAVYGKNVVKQGAEILGSKEVTDAVEDMVKEKSIEVPPADEQAKAQPMQDQETK